MALQQKEERPEPTACSVCHVVPPLPSQDATECPLSPSRCRATLLIFQPPEPASSVHISSQPVLASHVFCDSLRKQSRTHPTHVLSDMTWTSLSVPTSLPSSHLPFSVKLAFGMDAIRGLSLFAAEEGGNKVGNGMGVVMEKVIFSPSWALGLGWQPAVVAMVMGRQHCPTSSSRRT